MRGRYPGVYWHPQLKRWVVQVVVFVGAFDDEDEAYAVRVRLDRHTDDIRKMVGRIAGVGTEVRDHPIV